MVNGADGKDVGSTYCHTVRTPREEAMWAYGASEQNVELDWMCDWIDTP